MCVCVCVVNPFCTPYKFLTVCFCQIGWETEPAAASMCSMFFNSIKESTSEFIPMLFELNVMSFVSLAFRQSLGPSLFHHCASIFPVCCTVYIYVCWLRVIFGVSSSFIHIRIMHDILHILNTWHCKYFNIQCVCFNVLCRPKKKTEESNKKYTEFRYSRVLDEQKDE